MIRVTAAVIERDGKILIAKRKSTDRMGGRWEFPGGKLNLNESPEECLKRELKEELNIEAQIGEFICRSKFRYMLVPLELLVYRAKYVSGELKALEHDDIKWVLPADLNKYDFVKADIGVVERLIKGIHDER